MKNITIIKVSGHDVTLTRLGFRMWHFSAIVNGKLVTAAHYSRFGTCVIRDEIEKALKV
jgi:hypothetical protein